MVPESALGGVFSPLTLSKSPRVHEEKIAATSSRKLTKSRPGT